VITANQIPPESGLNADVVEALKAAEHWDLSDQWVWHTAPVHERVGESPLWTAHLALAAQCREIEADEGSIPVSL
jgi:hypothetical protein